MFRHLLSLSRSKTKLFLHLYPMENKLKLKISRMFCSSLTSCRSKNISDVMDQPFFFPENPHHHHQLIELFSPIKPPAPPSRTFPSICRPKPSQSTETEDTHLLFRSKFTDPTPVLPLPATNSGRKCSPATLISPPNNTFQDFNSTPKQRKQRRSRKTRKNKTTNVRNPKFDEFFNSVAGNYYGWYSSSEDEQEKENNRKDDDDETTFFSSKSMSSDSSESFRRNKANNRAPPAKKTERKELSGHQKDFVPLEGKVKDSFAVVKRSNDPHNDFRTSMVEMIVEKQIFGSKELENLLQCFLSLNSVSHHRVIVEVFTEIWETLFSDWA